MGLFDYVRCDIPLPDGKPTPRDLFQTKDFECPYMEHYVITAARRLVKLKALYSGPAWMSTPEDTDLNWHGWLNFYGGLPGEWREFNAKFTDGQLVEIQQVPKPE